MDDFESDSDGSFNLSELSDAKRQADKNKVVELTKNHLALQNEGDESSEEKEAASVQPLPPKDELKEKKPAETASQNSFKEKDTTEKAIIEQKEDKQATAMDDEVIESKSKNKLDEEEA